MSGYIGGGMRRAAGVRTAVEDAKPQNGEGPESQNQASSAPTNQDGTNHLTRLPREVLNKIISQSKTNSTPHEAQETRRQFGSTSKEIHEAVSENPDHQASATAAALHRRIEAQRSHANLTEIIELRGELDKLKDYVPSSIANANSDAYTAATREHARGTDPRALEDAEYSFLELGLR